MVNKKAEGVRRKVVVTVMSNQFLEHFLSYYNKKFTRLYFVTQKCDFASKEKLDLVGESLQSAKKVIDNIQIIKRKKMQKPGTMGVFFSTRLRDFELKGRNEESKRKPSLNTTKEKGFSRENTLDGSRFGSSLFEGQTILKKSSENFRDESIRFTDGMYMTVEGLHPPSSVGIESRLRRLSRDGRIRLPQNFNMDLKEEDFLLLNLKYHEDLTRSVQTDQLDEYVFSKNHSINVDVPFAEDDIMLISQFDCVINLQKNEANLERFYSCFGLQVLNLLPKLNVITSSSGTSLRNSLGFGRLIVLDSSSAEPTKSFDETLEAVLR